MHPSTLKMLNELPDPQPQYKNKEIRSNTPRSNDLVTAYGPKLRESLNFEQTRDRTKQSFKDECDINTIMSRYQTTGVIPPELLNPQDPRYVDVSGLDYQDAMFRVSAAENLFEKLPAKVRDRFKNDPAQFLEFAQNPDNQPEMVKMGLGRVEAAPLPPTQAPPPATPPTPPSAPANGIPAGQTTLPGVSP